MLIHQKVITGSHVTWCRDEYESLKEGIQECRDFWPGATVTVQRLRPNDWPDAEPEDCIVVEVAARAKARG
jgi:hypothetical protein